MRLASPPLLLVTDRLQARLPLLEVVRQALDAGCRWVSLREKDLPLSHQATLAGALTPLARGAGARLTLHGDAALAAAVRLDGVHLAAGSDAQAARALIGPEKSVGISIHTLAEAAAIDPASVDYAIAGPVFATASKPGYGPALGPGGLAALVRAARVPLLAIGGIEAGNIADVMTTGCAGIAVMGGVMRAENPAQAMGALLAALASAQDYPRAR